MINKDNVQWLVIILIFLTIAAVIYTQVTKCTFGVGYWHIVRQCILVCRSYFETVCRMGP